MPPAKNDGSWANYINNPSSSKTDIDSEDPYPSRSPGHGPSYEPRSGSSSGPVTPIDPYEHDSGHGRGTGKSTRLGSESGQRTVHASGPEGAGQGYEPGQKSGPGSGHRAHLPGSHPEGDSVTNSLPPIDPYEHGKSRSSGHKTPIYMSIKPREEITGGKGYRDDRSNGFKEEEQLILSPSRSDDLSEVQREVNKLPVLEETEESFKSSTRKPCCACCKENKPVLGGGYIEAASSAQIAPGPSAPQLLSPTPIVQSPPISPSQPSPIGYSQNPLVQSYYTPIQPTPVGGYGTGGGGSCGCAPQVCCQPVQPCCMRKLWSFIVCSLKLFVSRRFVKYTSIENSVKRFITSKSTGV